MEETNVSILSKLLWVSGLVPKDDALVTAGTLLVILDEDGWVLVRKEELAMR